MSEEHDFEVRPDPVEQSREFDALTTLLRTLQPLSEEARRRIVSSALTFLRIGGTDSYKSSGAPYSAPEPGMLPKFAKPDYQPFSENPQMTIKEFIVEKAPRTDVERIACLAYYLTHYRSTPHFKTIDLSILNTEAAQPKFANAANSANNAVKMGYLVPSVKGQRQLSAVGEQFVRALPDREAAKSVLASLRRKNRAKRGGLRRNFVVGQAG